MSLLPSGFISLVRLLTRQSWLKTGFPPTTVNLFGKYEWPRNSPDITPLDYHVWEVMLEHYKTFHSKPKNTDGLKKVLQLT